MVSNAPSTKGEDKKSFNFELVSPAKVEVRSFEDKVVIPGDDGDFMVLPGHTRLITNLRHGVLRVIRGDQEAHTIYITGGFADIGPDHCHVLASQATPVHKMDMSTLQERLTFLTDDLTETADDKKSDILEEIEEIERKLAVLNELKSA